LKNYFINCRIFLTISIIMEKSSSGSHEGEGCFFIIAKNLSEGYEQLKTMLNKVDFQDQNLNSRKEEVLNYSMDTNNIPVGLKTAQSIINNNKTLFEIQEHSPAAKKALTIDTETMNITMLNQLFLRFTFDLNRMIEDIKLHYIENDDYDSLSNLIDISKDVNVRDSDDNTLLMYATSCPSAGNKIITKLLEFRADPFIKCRFNETPFAKAINIDNLDLAKKYLEHKTKLLEYQSELQNNPLIEELHKLGEESKAEDFYCKLAHGLFTPGIMDILGLDDTSRDVCFLHIKENYEALGQDSDVLYSNT
jgi:hypothetical protein